MNVFQPILVLVALLLSTSVVLAQAEKELAAPKTDVLDTATWKKVDDSVERALSWLATQQKDDGSFETIDIGQPAITALSLMAFLAQGESPIDGKYQKQLSKAVDYIAAQQKANGLIALQAPNNVPIPRTLPANSHGELSVTVVYNHAISTLALAEAYGQCSDEQAKKLAPVIEKAIAATIEMQQWGGKKPHDKGGWRYITKRFSNGDSDLSITGWHLMFLRSARNAGFEVSKETIDLAVAYVERCYLTDEDRNVHGYMVKQRKQCTRAMAGAGVLALAHAGKHESKQAIGSGEWILKHGFEKYNDVTPAYGSSWLPDRYHYGALQCAQAMYQLGGKYWQQFFPSLVETLLANQQKDGSWPLEKTEREYGSCYTTSLCVLSLSVPNQMLPIFQR